MTAAQLVYSRKAPGDVEALSTSEHPLRLPRDDAGSAWRLSVEQQYTLVQTDDPSRGRWKVSTRAYRYRLDDDAGEAASWHWRPLGGSRFVRPHMHVSGGPLAGAHLPTRRVGVEAVFRLLLAELGARPRREDWRDVLDAAEAAFHEWQTWA